MITLQSLGFTIEDKPYFQQLSISFLPSAIIHLKGSNGSGKTSLLRMIAGIQNPSEGDLLFGKNQQPMSLLTKPYCCYVGHKSGLRHELTVLENIKYWAAMFDSEILIMAAIKYFDLEEILEVPCFELSEGNKQKVTLARLIVCPAKLWLLDEVDNNLDSANKALLYKLIVTHADGGGITIFTSHADSQIKTSMILNLSDYQKNY